MKKRLILTFILLITMISMGISQRIRDQVVLKNGSIIVGELVELKEGESVKIKSRDGSTWAFQWDEVEKVEKYQRTPGNFYNEVGIGINFNNDEYSYNNTNGALFFTMGYRINEKIALGLLTGFDWIHDCNIPLFADFNYHWKQNNEFDIVGSMQTGYLIPWDNYWVKNKGNFTVNPGVKFIRWISPKTGVFLGVGYRYTYMKTKYEDWGYGWVTRLYNYHRMSIKFGFYFN